MVSFRIRTERVVPKTGTRLMKIAVRVAPSLFIPSRKKMNPPTTKKMTKTSKMMRMSCSKNSSSAKKSPGELMILSVCT